jgi:hypothetical protein
VLSELARGIRRVGRLIIIRGMVRVASMVGIRELCKSPVKDDAILPASRSW